MVVFIVIIIIISSSSSSSISIINMISISIISTIIIIIIISSSSSSMISSMSIISSSIILELLLWLPVLAPTASRPRPLESESHTHTHTSFRYFSAINRSSSGQNQESELLIAASVLQAASWRLREPHPRAGERNHQFSIQPFNWKKDPENGEKPTKLYMCRFNCATERDTYTDTHTPLPNLCSRPRGVGSQCIARVTDIVSAVYVCFYM